MKRIFSALKSIAWMLFVPMTPSKFGKLVVLGIIFALNFQAWGSVVAGFAMSMLPDWMGIPVAGVATLIAAVGFTLCQWFEAAPEVSLMGCETPEVNADRLKLGSRNRFHAGVLAQDAYDELVAVHPVEVVRNKQAQAIAFGVDFVLSGASWYPFSAGPLQLALAPMGFLDFNLFNLAMLITTVFFTPRILISALKDGRIKTARGH